LLGKGGVTGKIVLVNPSSLQYALRP
jgi:hypothetical protein